LDKVTMTVDEVGQAMGISRPKAYELTEREDLPALHCCGDRSRGSVRLSRCCSPAASSSVALCPFGAVSSLAFFRRPIDSIPFGSRSNGRAGVLVQGRAGACCRCVF